MAIGRDRRNMRTSPGTMTMRPAAVAGQFYAGEADRLRQQVSALFDGVDAATTVRPKALIAPHAGYIYSGAIAAAAFATLRGDAPSITHVVLIGPAHYVAVRGIAVATADAFATPLGRVPVDGEAVDAIGGVSCVTRNDAPHAPEHALEVELPFLQTVLPSFKIVPLVVGEAAPPDVAAVLRLLWGGPETLIVVSSDLSHYHPYEVARRMDLTTAAAIERGDWARIGPNQACGWLAVAGLLLEAGHRGLAAERLALCNSADTAGSREAVVGYGAWSFAPA